MATQNISSLTSAIYKSRLTLLELMKEQNYNVFAYEGFSINEVNTMKTNNQLDMLLEKEQKQENVIQTSENQTVTIEVEQKEQPKKVYIKYYLNKSLRPNNLQDIIDDLFNIEQILTKKDTLFVVVKDEVNDTLQSTVKHIWEKDGIFVIILSLKRLKFNILKHVLVPPHRVLNQDELIQIKKKYNIINDKQFPEISRFDPVAQVIGIRPGEVCEIIRPSKIALTEPYYRICIS
jgi:DNA-directed RNA polymerase subunit H